ncbi:unnamed protein product [Oikopleura dioica]|uniref:ATP-dependent DNA helicase n=1 Tax=Oikopleura dioica TaxID=34765 RepID=E4XHP4_OIKDI|nr:unnamed protein product [Oikopleura dioica]
MDTTVSCNAIIEKLGPSGVLSTKKYSNCSLSITRSSNRDICIKVIHGSTASIYRVMTLKVMGKFIPAGKATIELDSDQGKRRFLISNASEEQLKDVLKLLLVKYNNQTPVKNKHLIIRGEVDEISPLRPKELEKVNLRLAAANKKELTPRKNTTPVRKLQQRRQVARKLGQLAAKPQLSMPAITVDKTPLNEIQKQIIAAARVGDSIFFTGAAGTGKSYVLKELIKSLPTDTTAITASTGCAAAPLQGQTLHAFAGIGVGQRTLENCIALVKSKKSLTRSWKKVRTIIIDEISMITADFFDLLEGVARGVRGNEKPFGGIQLIVAGDFLQLPPVSKGFGDDAERAKFCFQADSWNESINKVFELKEVFRQANDVEFCKMLNVIRTGCMPKWVVERIKGTKANHSDLPDLIVPTKLMTHNNQVDSLNKSELEKLQTDEKVYFAEDSAADSKILAVLNKMLPNAIQELRLKVGSQVMLTKNLAVSSGLVNGSRGVVEEFTESGPKVKFISHPKSIILKRERFGVKIADRLMCRCQYPLKLAWAMTKRQGMSLDLAQVSLSSAFEHGQAYVALSRCRSLKGLKVLDFNPLTITAHPDALAFHQSL